MNFSENNIILMVSEQQVGSKLQVFHFFISHHGEKENGYNAHLAISSWCTCPRNLIKLGSSRNSCHGLLLKIPSKAQDLDKGCTAVSARAVSQTFTLQNMKSNAVLILICWPDLLWEKHMCARAHTHTLSVLKINEWIHWKTPLCDIVL